jgi:Mrp family chromosome partitioning ATPase
MNRSFDLRLGACVLAAALGAAAAWHVFAPRTYVASAQVMVPQAGAQSRIVRLQSAALDPAEARSQLASQLVKYSAAALIDAPAVASASRSLALDLAIGGGLGLAFGAALTAWQARRRRPVRRERDLVPLLGNPLLAARPLQPEALRALARQLDEHWFGGARKLLPIVSVGKGDGRSRVVLQLAELFGKMGKRTLVIDANLRAPSLHRAFRLQNERGLADLLDDRPVQLAACDANLAVLVAGSVRDDPLELLSRPRLTHFLRAAARPFDIVLIDTPAADCGPDLEIFAALAGGALLVVRPGEDAARISHLRRRLTHCNARPVSSIFSRR